VYFDTNGRSFGPVFIYAYYLFDIRIVRVWRGLYSEILPSAN